MKWFGKKNILQVQYILTEVVWRIRNHFASGIQTKSKIMTSQSLETKKKFEFTARSITILFGLLFLLFFFLNFLYAQDPKTEESGILVKFDEENNDQHKAAPPSTSVATNIEEKLDEVEIPKAEKTEKVKTKKNVLEDERSKALVIKNDKEVEKTKAPDFSEFKDEIGDLFDFPTEEKIRPSSTEIHLDTDTDDQGNLNSGLGKIGGGLSSRNGFGPSILDKSQETGRVVVKICVDNNGKVLSSKYTLTGSTSSNSQLKQLAEANARKWEFEKGSLEVQCGTITYDFKVK